MNRLMAPHRIQGLTTVLVAVMALGAATVLMATSASAVTGIVANVQVTVDPTQDLDNLDVVTVHADAIAPTDLFEIQVHVCSPTDPDIGNGFDFSFDGAYCSPNAVAPGADVHESLAIAPGTGGEGTVQFTVGVGTGAPWTDADLISHQLTCDSSHPCDLVVQLQVSGGTAFFTAPLTFAAPTTTTTTSTTTSTTAPTTTTTDTTTTTAPTTTTTDTTTTTAPTTTTTDTTTTTAPTTTTTDTTTTTAPTTTTTDTTTTTAPTTTTTDTTTTTAPTTTTTDTTTTTAPTTTTTDTTTTTAPTTTTDTTTTTAPTTTTTGSTTTTAPGSTTTQATTSTTDPTTTTTDPVDVGGGEVPAGGQLVVSSTGWEPGSEVTITLNSDPITLGTLTADPSGRVTGQFIVPAGVPTGEHTVVLVGTGADGQPRTITKAVKVVAAAPATTTTTQPMSTTGTLARTGASSRTLLVLSLLLLGAGCVAVDVNRRLRPDG